MIISYFKGEPTKYVIRYKNGGVIKHGEGMDFWYLSFNSGATATIGVANQKANTLVDENHSA